MSADHNYLQIANRHMIEVIRHRLIQTAFDIPYDRTLQIAHHLAQALELTSNPEDPNKNHPDQPTPTPND